MWNLLKKDLEQDPDLTFTIASDQNPTYRHPSDKAIIDHFSRPVPLEELPAG